MALTFKGTNIGGFGGYEFTTILERNLKWWLDWGLLNRGAVGFATLGAGNIADSDESRLRPVHDERYEEGRVWNGYGREWVWEQGVSGVFRVSGVYLNGDFHPVGEAGLFAHHVDYQNGRIIFDKPIDPACNVQSEYCYRMAHVTSADDQDYREIMERTLENFAANNEPSGVPAREHQIFLPAIFIDTTRGSGRGAMLGGGQIKSRTVILQVVADRKDDRDLLADWLDFQNRASMFLADLNEVPLPFDEYGSVVAGVSNWPQMVTDHPWRKLAILDGRLAMLDSTNPSLFRARIEWDVEVQFGGI